jgi:Flp pilus assembly protein TadG
MTPGDSIGEMGMLIKCSKHDRIERRTGAAAAELAILLPFLFLMFSLALDFARIYCATQTMQNCASAGALYASGMAQSPSNPGPAATAVAAACAEGVSLSPPLQTDNVTVTSDGPSNTVTVTVQYQFQFVTPFLGSTLTLVQSATYPVAPVPGN